MYVYSADINSGFLVNNVRTSMKRDEKPDTSSKVEPIAPRRPRWEPAKVNRHSKRAGSEFAEVVG